MSADDPDDAAWNFAVTGPAARRIATWLRNNRKATGVLLAVSGSVFSIVSLFFPFAVIPDILVDITAASIAYIYLERVVQEEASVTGSASMSVNETVE